MTLRKVAIVVLNQVGILINQLYWSLPSSEKNKLWLSTVKCILIGKIPLLDFSTIHFLPVLLRERLKKEILSIGPAILNWAKTHEGYYIKSRCFGDILHLVCLTPEGTVDYGKTAEKLVYLSKLDDQDKDRLWDAYWKMFAVTV
ncbi:hypothetical protein AVEN_36780-1 [Araneus ventricosus]|uniref:Uncharacterized protein n=1 Tax=Araneus ventricosus TaxID=182803 RepID=A0A4Y2KLG2_ARAVE|nr:hypothetical protein AVEN_36780-1 [Araneus ventricosus]